MHIIIWLILLPVLLICGWFVYTQLKRKRATNEPCLTGNYAPVNKEIEVNELPVTDGSIPKELDGTFVRNGPNPQFTPYEGHHWFEGDGMLHSVRFMDGKASYKNSYIQTSSFLAEKAAGKALFLPIILMSGISSALRLFLENFRTILGGFNRYKRSTSNTSLVFHSGKLLTLMEVESPYLVYSPTLQTIAQYNFQGKLTHSFTAHPKIDTETGELFFFGLENTPPFVRYSIIDRNGNLGTSCPIDIPFSLMMHDFAITKKFTLFFDLPLLFKKENIARNRPMFEFSPNGSNCRIGVVPRYSKTGKDIKWYAIDPCFIFHTGNAYEEDGKIILTVVRHTSIDHSNILSLAKNGNSRLCKYEIDPLTDQVKDIPLPHVPTDVEFPTINENFTSIKNRYVYCSNIHQGTAAVYKYDFDLLTCTVRTTFDVSGSVSSGNKNIQGGEMIFVPRKDSSRDPVDEDDGWLVGYQYHLDTMMSSVVVLNAKDLSVQARVSLPQRVPQGFHGKWLNREMLKQEEIFYEKTSLLQKKI